MATSWEAYKKKREQENKASSNSSWSSYVANREAEKVTKSDISPLAKVVKEDIAPVKETSSKTEKNKRTWFNSGAFSDGYQFGDFTKTVLGTATDVQEDLAKGLYKIGEGVIDTGAYLLGGGAKLIGQDKFADSMKSFVERDLVEENKLGEKFANNSKTGMISNLLNGNYEALNPFDKKNAEDGAIYESNSLLGDKSDSLVQSGGQLAGTLGLQAVGVPWWVTTGVTSFGSGTQEAFSNDSTYGEAGAYGLISAGAEILTEKLGGITFGGKSLLSKATNGLTEGITSHTIKTLSKLGIDAFGEGGEEVLTSVITRLGQKLTYLKEDQWGDILSNPESLDKWIEDTWQHLTNKEARSEYGESFIGGMVLSGGMNAPKATTAIKTGVNYDTGLYTHEEQQLEESTKKAIGDLEAQGQKLNKKQKQAIEDSIKKEILQNRNTTPEDNTAQVEGLQQAIEEKQQELNQSQDVREQQIIQEELNILQEELNEATNAQQITNESDLRKQNFAYQAQETDSDIKKIVYESASKYFNDTKASHSFVDTVAKIAEDRGTKYEFVNTEAIKEAGYNVENASINGLVTEDGRVLLNIDSKQGLDFIVGHETTHLLEGTKEYQALQDTVIEYAKQKGIYDDRAAKLHSLYKGKGDINAELTSDLVGELLFTDSAFVESLSVKQPTLFEKIKNFISDLVVKFKGTEQEKQLRQLQRSFEKAYKAQSTETSNITKYSFVGQEITSRNPQAQEALRRAKELKEAHADMDYIRQNTHWFMANDGHWKAEVDDSGAKIIKKLEKNKTYRLGDILQHEDLYSFIPEYKNIEVVTTGMKAKGSFNPKTGVIKLNNNNVNNANQIRSTLLHEIQHATQAVEGFERGTNLKKAESYEAYKNNLGEVESREVQERRNMSFEDRMKIAPSTQTKTRYSLSEDGKMVDTSTNEEVKLEAAETGTHGTLMAIHNLNEQKLQGILELGGFPFPSIAITNPSKINHSSYGDISVVFDKNTIDPVSNKKNKVYSRDAYTPRFPRLEYKTDSTVIKNLRNRNNKLGDYTNRYVSDVNSFLDNIEDSLNNRGGIDGLIDRAKNNEALKYLYIKENNIPFKEQYKEESYSREVSNELLQKFLDNYKGDKDTLNQLGYEEVNALRDELEQLWIEENFKTAEEKAYLERKPDFKPDLNYSYLNNIVMGAYKLHKYGSRQILDTSKTNDLINNTVNQEEFESWLRNEFKDIVSKKGIRNNKDYYTPSGNPRSFEQLHDEYNLDNVVKIMTALDDTGSEGFFTGINNIAGNASIRFDSITEIKAKEDLIQSVSEEEYSAVLDDINNRLRDIENKIIERGHKNSDNPFIALDNLTESIATVARKFGENKRVTPTTITKELNEWGFYPTQEESQTILNMFSEMRGLPTEYFEAKPKRAVRFDEVQAIVVPNNIDNNTRQELLNNGLNVIEYDPNIEGDRQAKINELDDFKFSLSAQNEDIAPIGNVFGKDLKVQVEEAVAPLQEKIETLTEQLDTVVNSLEQLQAPTSQDIVEQQGQEAFDTITDEHAPSFEDVVDEIMWNEDTEFTNTEHTPSPFDTRDIDEVGNRKVKAYQYENPEVRPYFQEEAQNMMWDLNNTIKGERSFNDQLYYDSNGEQGFFGTTRQTTEAIAYLKDKYGYSYAQIEKGLNDIIEDNGKENNAVAKRIEFMLDERLREGYTTSDGIPIPPNEEYIKFLEERQITEYNREISSQLTDADVPVEETIEETPSGISPEHSELPVIEENAEGQLSVPLPETIAQNQNTELTDTQEQEKVAQILSERPTQENKKQRLWARARAAFFDKGSVFEDVSLKTKNRELEAKWDYSLPSEARAQNVFLNGYREFDSTTKTINQVSKGLYDIQAEVGNKVQEFSEYLYHKHNVDRMSIESNAQARMAELRNTTLKNYDFEGIEALSRKKIPNKTDKVSEQLQFKDVAKQAEVEINAAKEYMRLTEAKNKPVFGNSVTAEISQQKVNDYEMNNPEFMDWANDVYDYNKANLNQLVKSGVISQETADQFAEIYPNYVPIGRAKNLGNAINVPLDTNRTGVNAPIARATGGNSDILPLFDTMARRTLQTYRATAKNNFGIELKNTLNSVVDNQQTNVDEILDNVDQQENLLQEGKDGKAPTFTVFENGEKVTYEITEDMYDAFKPVSEGLKGNILWGIPNKISSFHRGVLTEYNPVFMLTNAIKDVQDILLNSQHAIKTYAKIPESYAQILNKGYWYQEYMANGGEQNSYFDSQEGTFDTERKGISKVLDLPPLKQISQLNNIIEVAPRLAEYIASRESGRSVETSMLDAARVTTNFKAGGDITKWANRNGATFLNASIQGAMQQVRNVREANANGLKGYANLASKFALAGVPAMILNSLLWGDDEEYEELSDYVKQSYWIVGKYGDGNFIRIPKGRMITVVQEALNQMTNLVTGNDEADLGQFLEIVGNNIAPNNPLENNVLSPFIQAATNKTWYGGDLVPTRLQDVPAEEQYDESIDKLSIAIGQATGISPYKINYVIDQYSGGVGDVFLPMMTQQAEGGKDDLVSNLIAPLTNKFTVDSTMKNQSVNDLYDLSDKLTTKANSSKATDEDILKNKYVNAVKTEMNELYKQKREIQNSDLSDSEKYNQVREIQDQINTMAKEAATNYENLTIKSDYSKVGNKEYFKNNEGQWEKVKEKEATELEEMNMSISEKNTYFKTKNEISKIAGIVEDSKDDITIEDEDSEEYKDAIKYLNSEKKEDIVNKVINSGLADNQKAYLYKKFYNTDTIDTIVNAQINVDDYLTYTTKEFKADYNAKGNAISGSRRDKVVNYVATLNLTRPQMAILIKSTNTFKFNDYNDEIVDYVGNLDIDYDTMVKVFKDLDMTVKDGRVYWDN